MPRCGVDEISRVSWHDDPHVIGKTAAEQPGELDTFELSPSYPQVN
jgi:hypothetical protein